MESDSGPGDWSGHRRAQSSPGPPDYGIREFRVRDPNGIEIVFGQDIQ